MMVHLSSRKRLFFATLSSCVGSRNAGLDASVAVCLRRRGGLDTVSTMLDFVLSF
jgi:hypothetical protein